MTHLAFLLHMHQPLYVDPATGQAVMPWVRLHGARGYLDVAWLLEQHPKVSLTVNFVPSLLEQLQAVVDGAVDAYQAAAVKPAWSDEERELIVERFFSVHWGRCVEPRPRYRELLEKRGRILGPGQLAERARAFSDREVRDLTVLFHLAWLGFAARADAEHGPAIADLEKKERNYTDEDLQAVLAAGRAACARVLPLYRALSARGQVELSSSPYYHPIVPLLIDTDAARRAMPSARLPPRFSYPADARAQIARARLTHAHHFGAPPRGMWPPEGSVSPEAVAAYRSEDIAWLATDEGNLWRSLGEGGASGHPGGALFQPWRFEGVDLVFRDRELSDRIGFSYAFVDAPGAVADLLGRARAAAAATPAGGAPPLVAAILDGENPWEAYPGHGEPFLRELFGALEQSADVRAVSIGGHLAEHPPRATLQKLHSGSWIDSDFHIWIADPVKNRAWELLGHARRRLERAVEAGAPAEQVERARAHLLAAEGSDWFWWFGEPFHSAEDGLYDRLFRAHLAAAWSALGEATPSELEVPVDGGARAQAVREPRGLIRPTVNGRVGSYFEWIDAGRFDVPRGSAMAEAPLVQQVHFGFDERQLYVRLDPAPEGRARLRAATLELLLRDDAREFSLTAPLASHALRIRQRRLDGTAAFADGGAAGELAFDEIVELAVPFAALGLGPGARAELAVRILEDGVPLARYPRDAHLPIAVPDENFAADHWSV